MSATKGTVFCDQHGGKWTVVGKSRDGFVVARGTDGWTKRFYASVVERARKEA